VTNELEAARKALETTLKDQDRSPEYIEDFMERYDRNLKNIDNWAYAKSMFDAFLNMQDGTLRDEEIISLRADDDGKPIFHVPPKALAWLMDFSI
jgi:hypothetical protein